MTAIGRRRPSSTWLPAFAVRRRGARLASGPQPRSCRERSPWRASHSRRNSGKHSSDKKQSQVVYWSDQPHPLHVHGSCPFRNGCAPPIVYCEEQRANCRTRSSRSAMPWQNGRQTATCLPSSDSLRILRRRRAGEREAQLRVSVRRSPVGALRKSRAA